MSTEETSLPINDVKGKFAANLIRNNKKIREDRALVIVESAEMFYKRKVEDLTVQLRQLRRDRDNMLDLSPTSADSLTLASEFDASKFVETDLDLGVKIRNLEIKLEVAQSRYNELFTEKIEN